MKNVNDETEGNLLNALEKLFEKTNALLGSDCVSTCHVQRSVLVSRDSRARAEERKERDDDDDIPSISDGPSMIV